MKADQRPFHFKQFSLYHHRSTMKVGTDAVLLGIWTELNQVNTVLEVGAGSGVISLLLGSRAKLQIDALEMDKPSCEEAAENFSKAKLKSVFNVIHTDFNDFVNSSSKKYDLIVSNPPFFVNDLKSNNQIRRQARHAETLTYEQLIDGAVHLLNPNGKLSVVLPYKESRMFSSMARQSGLFIKKQMLIFPKHCAPPNRINLLFTKNEVGAQTEKLIIRKEDGHYTQQYLDWVDDFYLF